MYNQCFSTLGYKTLISIADDKLANNKIHESQGLKVSMNNMRHSFS